ncbi:hypothetical protein H6776_02150 [Candidatus Nomurabacteria bacterium]|nr:hypothetical protein [Candidatus Nomurabacteria bacterium]
MSTLRDTFYNRMLASLRALSPFEQLLTVIAISIILIFLFSLVFGLSHQSTTSWPQSGGRIVEGSVGTPRFIHPLYATSTTERDLAMLVYSGLMREIEDGVFVPDLAQSYTRSEDGRTYTFTLRDDAVFHDGYPVKADDIVFTYTQAQTLNENPNLRAQWQDITIQKIDDTTIEIELKEPFADFIDQTTLGILPQHIWSDLNEDVVFSPYMLQPIGSGPFMIKRIESDENGLPVSFVLHRFKDFTLGTPYLRQITYRILSTYEALYAASDAHRVDSFVDEYTNTHTLPSGQRLEQIHMNRLFGLFVGKKSTSPLSDSSILHALEYFIDKEALLQDLFNGYGVARSGVLGVSFDDSALTVPFDPEVGYARLAEKGWTYDPARAMIVSSLEDTSSNQLSFTLATSNAPHLIATAEYLREVLGSYGIQVDLDIYTSDALIENVIPKRDFDVLLFGMSIPYPASVSAFWHSSQQKDPGRNITQYINNATDTLLKKAHTEYDAATRMTLYSDFDALLAQDRTAIMLYAPDVIYEMPARLHTALPNVIDTPRERFSLVYKWYIKSVSVWNIFTPK